MWTRGGRIWTKGEALLKHISKSVGWYEVGAPCMARACLRVMGMYEIYMSYSSNS